MKDVTWFSRFVHDFPLPSSEAVSLSNVNPTQVPAAVSRSKAWLCPQPCVSPPPHDPWYSWSTVLRNVVRLREIAATVNAVKIENLAENPRDLHSRGSGELIFVASEAGWEVGCLGGRVRSCDTHDILWYPTRCWKSFFSMWKSRDLVTTSSQSTALSWNLQIAAMAWLVSLANPGAFKPFGKP